MAITHARTQANIINMMSMSRIQQVKTEKKITEGAFVYECLGETKKNDGKCSTGGR